ncbi:MAG: hypothetical protein GY816_09045 [Cytophagales bacterium]|nr:hypothetical protein [Cytophagales bacterium]
MSLKQKIGQFKQKSYWTNGISGILITLIVGLSVFLILSSLEYSFWFSSSTRSVFFYFLVCLVMLFLIFKVLLPFLSYFKILKQTNDEKAAESISEKIPEIEDKLINYLQLEKQAKTGLAKASIEQKIKSLGIVDFAKAVDGKKGKKYGRYLAFLLIFFGLIAFVNPPLITKGGERIVRHNKTFVKPAPFSFVILNDSLSTFKHQNFELHVKLNGENLPNQMYLIANEQKVSLSQSNSGIFSHVFEKPTQEIEFNLESAGFSSQSHMLKLYNRPELKLMSVKLEYPDYISQDDQTITNSGNISAPAGTMATWSFEAGSTDEAAFYFANDTLNATRLNEESFSISKELKASGNYTIQLSNSFAINESALNYRLNIIPDELPSVRVNFIPDTAFHKYVIVTGEIEDDYGFHSLRFHYQLGKKVFSKEVPINTGLKKQGFYTEWVADTIAFNNRLTLYAVVRDNDYPGGFKAVKSRVFSFVKPSLSELAESINKKSQSAEDQLEKAISETEELRKSLKDLADRLKSQNELGWQEEKIIDESLEQREELEKMLEELSKKHEDLLKANQNFEQSKQLQEKSEQLDKLIEDLMDDETRQLYEELEKLMADKKSADEIRDKIEQISRQENRKQKDLERIKELFKRQKIEFGLEHASQQLDSLASKQLELSDQAIDSSAMSEQDTLQKEFEEIAKDLEEITELNQELDKPEPLDDFKTDEQDIAQEMDNAKDEMKSGDKKKSKQSQENAAKKMQQMSKKMQQMQAGMEMEVMQENIEHLRKILDDLVRLSYRQEDILEEFKGVNASDPRFLALSQNQVKLKEDVKVIEDSLLALAGRVVQLSSFITKEIEDVNNHMTDAVAQIKDRQRGRALSHQQFSMTSMNNLALLLNDVLQQMQMTMSEAMGKAKGKPQNTPQPSLGEMQQQLGEQMKDLKEGGKTGRKLSEELARMAAEQEMIRQQLEELKNKLNGQPGGSESANDLQKAIELMEKNEVDLVNKRLTQQLLNRQKEITTRMLEAEDALKEQQKEPDREAESALQRERLFPPNFEEYLKNRKKEIELLRTVPIELKPFYKKEVNDYFRRLSEKQ